MSGHADTIREALEHESAWSMGDESRSEALAALDALTGDLSAAREALERIAAYSTLPGYAKATDQRAMIVLARAVLSSLEGTPAAEEAAR